MVLFILLKIKVLDAGSHPLFHVSKGYFHNSCTGKNIYYFGIYIRKPFISVLLYLGIIPDQ